MRGVASSSTAPSDGTQDLILVRRALGGDSTAIEQVLARLSCIVRFVFRLNRRLGCHLPTESLEDVVQQVYAAVWPRLEGYSGSAALESWVFGFCRNCLRAEVRRRSNHLRLLPPETEADRLADPGGEAARPEESLLQFERVDALRDELARLEPDERAVVELRHLEDWSFERIARHFGEPASTVKDRCYRALEKLRGRLRRRDVSA